MYVRSEIFGSRLRPGPGARQGAAAPAMATSPSRSEKPAILEREAPHDAS